MVAERRSYSAASEQLCGFICKVLLCAPRWAPIVLVENK